jgi:hypothetical protein
MMQLITTALAVALAVLSHRAWAQGSLPDPARTPGMIDPRVTQENIGETICVPGWTRTVRPPAGFTYQLKRDQMRSWGYVDRRSSEYEEDHLVPLDLGGAASDPRNLWPQPRQDDAGWTADRKDEVEVVLGRLVCAGRVTLSEAQVAIASDWIAAYTRYVTGFASR